MFERAGPILKALCAVLAAVLVLLLARVLVRHNPVGKLSIPALPTLPAKTNDVAKTKSTNAAPAKADAKNGINSVAGQKSAKAGTNAAAAQAAGIKEKGTNATAINAVKETVTNAAGTNAPVSNAPGTNAAAAVAKPETNLVASVHGERVGTNTNALSSQDFGKMGTNKDSTNLASTNAADKKGTNVVAGQASAKGRTNAAHGRAAMGMGMPGFGPGMMGGMGREKLPDLPPLIQARVDKIVQSEILAQLTKPQPAALIGIAGNGAMLRASSGQTGFVKEGGELGGIKLLRLGINRVLVEEDGQKKELMIFEGIGGETLLPKQGETNEIISKTP